MSLDTTIVTLIVIYLVTVVGSVIQIAYSWHKRKNTIKKHTDSKPKLKLIRGNRGIK